MLRLSQLTFDIRSIMKMNNQTILPSKEDIQKTFESLQYTEIKSYINHFQNRNEYQCHVYTYPSQMSFYHYLSNQFPGGYYPYVSIVSLYDEYPFEHQFFLQLVQSFPFIEKLVLSNNQSQQCKHSCQSKNANYHFSVVKYAHVIELHLNSINDDYIEEFLCDTKTSFRNNIRLHIPVNALSRVTKHFTRNDTRKNCAKVDSLFSWTDWTPSKSFEEYFSSIKKYYHFSSFYG